MVLAASGACLGARETGNTVFSLVNFINTVLSLVNFINTVLSLVQELMDMNKAPPSKLLRETKEYQPLIEKYETWRNEREERLA